jgi:1-aminocyclopropane-1-carboxylate deaminase/D-cysteine desulfhydrase-like pyridoxal-dependent ACC family enzyme
MERNMLTPIEEYNGIYFKRDDKFAPYPDLPINGGKVRQAIALIEDNLDLIKTKYNNTVLTITSVNSPQGLIISKVCKEYGVHTILGIGATNTPDKHPLIKGAKNNGADVVILSKLGFNSALYAEATRKFGNNYFIVLFGINASNNKNAIIDTTADQVENILDVDYLIVPMGSALTMLGIFTGIKKFKKNIGKIIGVQIAGIDRSKVFFPMCKYYTFEQVLYKKYPYSKHLKIKFSDTEYLDPVYEAKAYDWMMDNELKGSKLFWIVGNTTDIRNYY